jgi:hypothetical protein
MKPEERALPEQRQRPLMSHSYCYAASNKPGTRHERIAARAEANQTIGVEIEREARHRELHTRYRRGEISFARFKRQLRRPRTREPARCAISRAAPHRTLEQERGSEVDARL